MKITIERGKRRYEVVPCGRRCSFARDDSDGEPIYNTSIWQASHCCHDCYLPKWWKNHPISIASAKHGGLREIGGAK